MALPLVVIEQLARTLRNRETTIELKALDAYSRIARKALLGTGGFSPADALEIYSGRLENVLPLPFGRHNFAADHSYVDFDHHRVLATGVDDQRGYYKHPMNWLVVARGDDGDYVIAAADSHFFELDEVVRPFDLALVGGDQPVKYNSLMLSHGLAVYLVEDWKEAAVILDGYYNPLSNDEFTIDVAVDIPAPQAEPKPDHMERTSDSLTLPGTDVHPNGVSILGGVQKHSGVMIDLPDSLTEEQRGKVIEYVESLIAEASAPADEKAAAVDALVNRLYELYAADFRKMLGRIEGNVSDIKIRKAFKDYFVAKWNLNK